MIGTNVNRDYLLSLIFESIPSCQMSKENFVKTLQKPAEEFPSGALETLFKATFHLNICFKLVASDPKSKQLKTLSLCSGFHLSKATNCPKVLQLTCSVNFRFFLILSDKGDNDQHRYLESPSDLSWCLLHMNSHYYGYSIHPTTNENELTVIVNNGQILVEAIKENIKEDTTIVFFAEKYLMSFCKAVHQHL